MILKHRSLFCVALFAFPALVHINAETVYREAVSGDLSNSGLTPTVIPVSLGSNQIFGTTGRVTATDRDYFTITVPTGLQIGQILELGGTAVGDAVSFFGIQRGSQVTLPTTATTADGLLGWTHYSPVNTGTDILPELQIPAEGSAGFTGALPAGNYAFWIQDFGAGTFSYAFDIRLTAATTASAPEPASYASALLGALLLTFIIRRYRHSQA